MTEVSLSKLFRVWLFGLIFVTLGLAFASVSLYFQTTKLYQMNEFNMYLSRDNSTFVMLANEQLVYETARFDQQLEDASENLKRTLQSVRGMLSDADREILLVYLADIRFLLKRYHLYDNHPAGEKIRRTVFDGIMSKIYGFDAEVNRMTQNAQAKFQQSAQFFLAVLGIFLLILLFLPMVMIHKFRGLLISSIAKVSSSAQAMIDQKFQQPIPNTELIEVNDIVHSLNRLRSRLLSEMASRADLEKEMQQRAAAEHEVRELLQELQDNHQRMLQMEKLSAMGTMVGGVAHELNNPLMGILNYIQYSQTRCENEKAVEMLKRAEQEVTRIQALVSNMLVFSRTSKEVTMQAVKLRSLIEEVLLLLEGTFKKQNVMVELEVPEDLQVNSSPDLLKQVLVNLIGNAKDALENIQTPRLEIIWSEESGVGKLQIIDNGSGIDVETQRKIFDPFFTTKQVGKGTGLGLSISKEMATSMGGDLILEQSRPGYTRFSLALNPLN